MVQYISLSLSIQIQIPRLFPPLISTLISLSVLFTIPALVLSLLNRDREVEGLGIAAIILTLSFHFVVGVWSWVYTVRRQEEEGVVESMMTMTMTPTPTPRDHPGHRDYSTSTYSIDESESEYPRYYTSPGTISAYALSIFWFLSFAINTQDILNGPNLFLAVEVNAKWRLGVEVAESVVMGIQGLLAGLLAGYCTVVRKEIGKRRRGRREEEDPTWKMVQAKSGRVSSSGLSAAESGPIIVPIQRTGNNYEDDEIRERSRFSSDSSLLRVPPRATLQRKPSLFSVPSPLRVVVNTLPVTD